DRFAALTGRAYRLFDYTGAPDAERVVVIMGSGAGAAEEAMEALNRRGEKVGLLKVRLYRPFAVQQFVDALPTPTRAVGGPDRATGRGSIGEPLCLDVVAAIQEAVAAGEAPFRTAPRVLGGRYGLSSKEFTPAMAKAVFAELARERPKNHFTIGIHDDV